MNKISEKIKKNKNPKNLKTKKPKNLKKPKKL
jgi:hypothetical protein